MATTVEPGVVLTVNGKQVTLEPSDAALAGGKHYELLEPVDLGTPASITNMLADVGAPNFDLNAEIAQLPPPLDTIAGKLANVDIIVQKFELTIPPADNQGNRGPTTFTLGLAGMWPEADGLITVGPLSIRGVYLLVKEDGITTPPTP